MPMHFAGGGIAPGASSSLTLSSLSPTSVVATVAPVGGTLIDWDLERTTDGGVTWTVFQGSIVTAAATIAIDPKTTYVFRAVVRIEAAATSATVSFTSQAAE